jgi:hypothetical protein
MIAARRSSGGSAGARLAAVAGSSGTGRPAAAGGVAESADIVITRSTILE